MSTTDSTARVASPENGSPYAAGDWWGDGDGDDRDDGDQEESLDPNDPDLFIAHAIRKGRQGVVCGRSYDDGREVDLSDPCVFIGDTAGEMRHAKRFNAETGWMNWGEGTWTRIPDGTLDELLADLKLWFEMSDRRLLESERETLCDLARRQKKQQHENDLTDTQIMANVVNEVRSPGAIST